MVARIDLEELECGAGLEALDFCFAREDVSALAGFPAGVRGGGAGLGLVLVGGEGSVNLGGTGEERGCELWSEM